MFRRRTPEIPHEPVDYPVGTFISTETGFFYIAGNTKRYRITSKRILESWSPQRVVESSEAAVRKYRIAAKMKFRNGSLIHNIADGKIYLIVGGKRCHMTSPEAFERLGVSPNREHVVSVSLAEIKLHEEGEDLT